MRPPALQPRTITLILNDRCPLRCAHCSIGYSKEHHGSSRTMEAVDIEAILESLDPEVYSMVVLAGGEPSLVPKTVARAVELCRARDLHSALTTAPVWARTALSAKEFLTRVRQPDFLILSCDKYHLAALPFEQYRTAAVAAQELGIYVALNVCYGNDRERRELQDLIATIGIVLTGTTWSKIMPYGNAAALQPEANEALELLSEHDLDRLPLTCKIGNALVNIDQELHACCWSGDLQGSPLQFSAKTPTVSDFKGMEQDPLFRTLHARGFVGALSSEQRKRVLDLYRGRSFVSECHLCTTFLRDSSTMPQGPSRNMAQSPLFTVFQATR